MGLDADELDQFADIWPQPTLITGYSTAAASALVTIFIVGAAAGWHKCSGQVCLFTMMQSNGDEDTGDEDTPPTIARLMRWGEGFFEGIACLEALLSWTRSGSSSMVDLAVDPSILSSRVEVFECALSELKEGVESEEMEGGPPVDADDLARARRLKTLLKTWTPGSDLPSEVVTLAEQLINKFGDEQERTNDP